MKHTAATIICILLALSMLLTACGSSTAQPAEKATETNTVQSAEQDEETVVLDGITLSKKYAGTTIVFTGGGDTTTAFGKATLEHIAEFEEATGITVELDALTDVEISRKLAIDSAAGGEGLDVFMMRPGQETKAFVSNGWVRDISSFMQDEGDYEFGDIAEESLKVCMVDGKLYSIHQPASSVRTVRKGRKNHSCSGSPPQDSHLKGWHSCKRESDVSMPLLSYQNSP